MPDNDLDRILVDLRRQRTNLDAAIVERNRLTDKRDVDDAKAAEHGGEPLDEGLD